jgi:hypothetical protein
MAKLIEGIRKMGQIILNKDRLLEVISDINKIEETKEYDILRTLKCAVS